MNPFREWEGDGLSSKNKEDTTELGTAAFLLGTWVAVLIGVFLFLCWIIQMRAYLWYQYMGMMVSVTVFLLIIANVVGMVVLFSLWYNIRVPERVIGVFRVYVRTVYPILMWIGKVAGADDDRVRRVFTRLNNKIVMDRERSYEPNEVLIITPHCLQKTTCTVKITHDLQHCKECGDCDVSSLVNLAKKWSVNVLVVTGGTVARKVIKDKRPGFIIAVACERDLTSGLMDTKKIPVYAIINERPEGPCMNTRFDINEMEELLNQLIKR